MKKLFALWLTLLLCLSLTACGGSGSTDPDDVAGDDWRVTGVVRDTGTITRNGGDVDVLVCINADSADFYYDDATPVMYDYAAYPIALQCDPWEAFRSIDFADRNGDGNSDVALLFELDGAQALITGESVGQVASQTMTALGTTDMVVDMPVFRPLIGFDKEEIIAVSEKIGTFETSSLPYEDCCTVFTPRHPKTRPSLEEIQEAEAALDIDGLIETAMQGIERVVLHP